MFENKNLIVIIIFLLVVILITGCSNNNIDNYVVSGTVIYNGTSAAEASVKASGAKLDKDITVITDAEGQFKLTGLAGKVKIIGIYDGHSKEATVRGAESDLIIEITNYASLTLSETSVEIVKENSVSITATAVKADGSTDTIESANSNDSNIATASLNGNEITIEGVSVGEAVITVTSGSGLEATCNVTVVKDHSSLTLSETSVETYEGHSVSITATAVKADGSTDTIESANSNASNIATASLNGNEITIEGVSVGEAVITVTSGSGLEATCNVTVAEDHSSLTLDQSSVIATTTEPTTIVAKAVKPDGQTTDTISATSADESIAVVSVSGDEITITGVSLGDITITVTSDSGKTASCTVYAGESATRTSMHNENLSKEDGYYEFLFTIIQNGLYEFKTSYYETACDTVLYIYDDNNNLIAKNDDTVDGQYAHVMKKLTTGDYTAVIEEANQLELKTYFEVYFVEFE